jgi:hypothetical protein
MSFTPWEAVSQQQTCRWTRDTGAFEQREHQRREQGEKNKVRETGAPTERRLDAETAYQRTKM